jgi:hypothetical protein
MAGIRHTCCDWLSDNNSTAPSTKLAPAWIERNHTARMAEENIKLGGIRYSINTRTPLRWLTA